MARRLAPQQPSIRHLLAVNDGFVLSEIDPRRVLAGPKDKDAARTEIAALAPKVAALQEMLWAEAKRGATRRVVVVLQGTDTSGKGGATRLVDSLLDPAGLAVTGFGKPTPEELRRHFLWRFEQRLPRPGTVAVFDRSYYEDVLVVRVNRLVSERTWKPRYQRINDWEAALVDEGVSFVKVMLYISADEQRERLLARLADPTKQWKYNPGDVDERAKWSAYAEAYQDALTRCSTPAAPWYVVPADRKWHRDWLLAHLLHETLAALAPAYPAPDYDVAHETARVAAS
jgi:PPK2 family polyphosphate:nucleotide phosphotransferase